MDKSSHQGQDAIHKIIQGKCNRNNCCIFVAAIQDMISGHNFKLKTIKNLKKKYDCNSYTFFFKGLSLSTVNN